MARTPTADPTVLTEWHKRRDALVENEKISLRQIALRISAEYGCSPDTVRLHLDPAYADRKRRSARESARRRRDRVKKRRDYFRERSRKYRAERGDQVRQYKRSYYKMRSPDARQRLLGMIFAERDSLTLEQIAKALPEYVDGIRFRPKTVEKWLLHAHLDWQGKALGERAPPQLARLTDGSWTYGAGAVAQ